MINANASDNFPISATLVDDDGVLDSGKVVSYSIRLLDDSVVKTGLLVESSIDSGIYSSIVSLDKGSYMCYVSCDGYNTSAEEILINAVSDVSDSVWAHSTAVALTDNVKFIKDVESGKWEIVGDQMIFYAGDNNTELMRFNLFDKENNRASEAVYKREIP
jgi:hypothetical protein